MLFPQKRNFTLFSQEKIKLKNDFNNKVTSAPKVYYSQCLAQAQWKVHGYPANSVVGPGNQQSQIFKMPFLFTKSILLVIVVRRDPFTQILFIEKAENPHKSIRCLKKFLNFSFEPKLLVCLFICFVFYRRMEMSWIFCAQIVLRTKQNNQHRREFTK